MMKRKIEAMRERFGPGKGTCGECSHFVKGRYKTRDLQKCEVYGMTHSEASDWAQKWEACGLKNKPYSGKQIIDLIKHEPKEQVEEQLPGQMSIDDWMGGTE